MEIPSTYSPFAELGDPKGWINGKALKGSFFFIHFNLKFILVRFLNKLRAVSRWNLHSNSVGPWVHCRFIGRRWDGPGTPIYKTRMITKCLTFEWYGFAAKQEKVNPKITSSNTTLLSIPEIQKQSWHYSIRLYEVMRISTILAMIKFTFIHM